MNFYRRFGAEIIRSAVIALVISSTFAGAAFWQWSQTAGTNSSADPNINWAIGMAPSAVSGSSRAMMAALAKYRDDVSGLVTTSGTSTAYTATSNQGMCNSPTTTPQDGQKIALTMSATNGIAPTLTVDTCSAFPIQSSAGSAVPVATLISGSPYTFKFSNANSAWMLRDFYGSSLNVPLGGLVAYTGTTVPNSNFVLPAGQCLSTTTYATYWVLVGSPASGSCSGGQFQIIDVRGRSLVALDNLNGSAANRLTSSSTGCGTAMTSVGATCANGTQSQALITANLPPYTPSGTITNGTIDSFTNNISSGTGGGTFNLSVGGFSGSVTFNFGNSGLVIHQNTSTFSGSAQGGSSTPVPNVPPNVAVTYLLRVL